MNLKEENMCHASGLFRDRWLSGRCDPPRRVQADVRNLESTFSTSENEYVQDLVQALSFWSSGHVPENWRPRDVPGVQSSGCSRLNAASDWSPLWISQAEAIGVPATSFWAPSTAPSRRREVKGRSVRWCRRTWRAKKRWDTCLVIVFI